MRVLSLTINGLVESKSGSRAAALSFSSLLGLGPLVALVMLIAGIVLTNPNDSDLVAHKLDRLLHRILPQLTDYDELREHQVQAELSAGPGGAAPATADSGTISEMTKLINNFITGSRRGAVGVVGALTLLLIVLQLFTSVENAFNEIWGVRRGRSLLMRAVCYWTVLTLGAVLFFGAAIGLSASAFLGAFAGRMFGGPQMLPLLRLLLPALSVALLVVLLTLFYRFIPNTKVWWRAAFVGAVAVAMLLVLNNYLAFLYVRRVTLQSSLYGPLSLVPVLMAGLYVFWLFVLVGGQVSYAVQNVHFRNSQMAWGALAESKRAQLSLLVLLTIARRFQAGEPPRSAAQLGEALNVPTQILNECLNRLVLMQLVIVVPEAPAHNSVDFHYQPARPLDRITLGEFKHLEDNFGEARSGSLLAGLDPLLPVYADSLRRALDTDFFQTPLDRLLGSYPTRPRKKAGKA